MFSLMYQKVTSLIKKKKKKDISLKWKFETRNLGNSAFYHSEGRLFIIFLKIGVIFVQSFSIGLGHYELQP